MDGEISRRGFIQGSLAYATLLSGLVGCATSSGGKPLELTSILDQPATRVTNRASPPVMSGYGISRWDFLGHYHSRNFLGAAGIDYAPISNKTEIVPVASGVVGGYWKGHPIGGNMLFIHHGSGFVSWYVHLEDNNSYEKPGDVGFVKLGDVVKRNTVIALMGTTGSGAARFGKHLHLTLIGPSYTKHLDFKNVQEYDANSPALSKFMIDPEELSVMGRHISLPFQMSEDLELDGRFNFRVEEARRYVADTYKSFPTIQPPKFSERLKRIAQDVGNVDFTLDRLILELHRQVSKESPTIPKSDAVKIRTELEDIMIHAIPELTAPIKDEKNPQYYTYLR